MPACHAGCPKTPLDLVMDVCLLQVPRHVSGEMIAEYGLPPFSPFFCHNWAQLLPCILHRELLLSVPDLESPLRSRLDALIAQQSAAMASSDCVAWIIRARLHRDLYEQVSRPPTHARTHTDTLAKFLR